MSTTNVAVPGTVIPSGSLTSPAGGQGIQGLQGVAGESYPIGVIVPYTSTTAPPTWMICDGSAISRTTYPALFAVCGTSFGAGDGSTTFNLPDLRGRVGVGAGQGAAPLSNRLLAAIGGEETHQLTIGELASHTHIQNAHTHSIPNVVVATGGTVGGGAGSMSVGSVGSTTATNQNTGSDTAHNTMQPFVVVAYIIKVSSGGGATAQAPIADTTQSGLLRQVSGNTTDFIDGTNHPVDLGATVLGQTTVTNAGLTKSIIVPLYANHPDRIWTYNAFDDHFDSPASGTPNAKWVYAVNSGLGNPVYKQAGSRLFMSESGAGDTTTRNQVLSQNLPSSNPLTLTAKVDCILLPYYAIGAGTVSIATFSIRLLSAGGGGVGLGFEADFVKNSNLALNYLNLFYGPALATSVYLLTINFSMYWRFVYHADFSTDVLFSFDAVNFMAYQTVAGASSGFSSTPPSQVQLVLGANNAPYSAVYIDWIRVTYP